MADPAQRQQQRHRRALPRLHVRQSELAVADLPPPAAGGRAVGRQPRGFRGVVVVRERIADLGQGTARACQGDAGARRSRQCRAPGTRGLALRSDVGRYRERSARHVRRRCSAPATRRRGWTLFAYTTENEAAAMRAAKRLGAGYVALVKARLASVRKAANAKACWKPCRTNCTATPAIVFAKIQQLRREEKYPEAAQLMLGAPRDPARLYNLERVVDRAAADFAQDDRSRRIQDRLPDRARCGAAHPRHLQDRAGVHRGLDRAALPQRSRDRRPAFCADRRRQRQSDDTGARRLLEGPCSGGDGPRAGGAHLLRLGGRTIDELLRPTGARQAQAAAARAQRCAALARRRTAGSRPRRATALRPRRARDRDPDLCRCRRERRCGRDHGPWRADRALWLRARHDPGRQGRAQPRHAVRFLRLSGDWAFRITARSGPTSRRACCSRSRGRKASSTRATSRRRRPTG